MFARTSLYPRAAIPWSAQFLLQLAHAYVALGDAVGVRAVKGPERGAHEEKENGAADADEVAEDDGAAIGPEKGTQVW